MGEEDEDTETWVLLKSYQCAIREKKSKLFKIAGKCGVELEEQLATEDRREMREGRSEKVVQHKDRARRRKAENVKSRGR